MAVPAHDSRDYEFATKFDIPILPVVKPDVEDSDLGKAYAGEGTVMNSSNPTLGLDINGLPNKVAASKVIEWAEKTGNGRKKVHLKFAIFGVERVMGLMLPLTSMFLLVSNFCNFRSITSCGTGFLLGSVIGENQSQLFSWRKLVNLFQFLKLICLLHYQNWTTLLPQEQENHLYLKLFLG